MAQIEVKQNPEAIVTTEIMADSIVAISAGIKKLRAGRLNDEALFLLVQNGIRTAGNGKVSLAAIRAVMRGLEDLEKIYLRQKIRKA